MAKRFGQKIGPETGEVPGPVSCGYKGSLLLLHWNCDLERKLASELPDARAVGNVRPEDHAR